MEIQKILLLYCTIMYICAGNLTNVTVQVNDFVTNDLSAYQSTSMLKNNTILYQQNLKNLTKYMGLVLINTTIDSLEENDITDLPNLRELSLASTEIQQMSPGCFSNLPELKYLFLCGNTLRKLYRGIFNGLPIVLLDLSNNRIREIAAGTFENVTELLELDLSQNYLSEINSESFRDLASLEILQLSGNMIYVIPNYAFKYLESLQHLHLGLNQIRNLEDKSLRGLRNLLMLDLSYNNILSVREDVFVDQETKLEQLFLCGNMLQCNVVRRLTEFLENLVLVTSEADDCKSRVEFSGVVYSYRRPTLKHREGHILYYKTKLAGRSPNLKKFSAIKVEC